MAYNPLNPNGQATMVNSQPVVIASNQSPVSIAGTINIAGNPSISGQVGASIIGLTPIQIPGSVAVAIVSGSIAVSITPPANQSVSGIVGASIVGQLPAGTAVLGSIATLQGTNPWFTVGSVSGQVSASIIGTVPTTQSGIQYTSVVGSYSEDSGHINADIGIFTMGVRNDTLASITSNDLDYSPHVVGPSGETVVANAPLTKWIQGNASLFTGVIQPVIAAQGSSIFTYITGVQVMNASANNAYLTFYGATGSVVGYTAAPANGGSNIVIPNAWKTNANGAFSASVSGVASVFLAAEGFISKS